QAKPPFETNGFERAECVMPTNSVQPTSTGHKGRGSPAHSLGMIGPAGGYFTENCEISGLNLRLVFVHIDRDVCKIFGAGEFGLQFARTVGVAQEQAVRDVGAFVGCARVLEMT